MFENLWKQLLSLDIKNRFGLKEKIFFLKELSFLLDGWISVIDSIQNMKDNSDNQTIINICDVIYNSLNKWENLSRSMSRVWKKYFSEWDINIIKSGENSWEVPKVLKYLSNEYEFLKTIKWKYINAISYPMIVVVLWIFATIFLFTKVIPEILVVVENINMEDVPYTTLMLQNITDFFVNNYTLLMLIFVAIILTWFIFIFTKEWKDLFDKFVFKIPIFGKITKYYFLIKFLRYFRLLLDSWLKYIDIFLTLKDVLWNKIYKDLMDDIVAGIRKWENIWDFFVLYKNIIPSNVISLLKAWEKTATLDKSIQNSLNLYEEEFNNMILNLSKVIEPVLLIVVWWVVAFIALSVFGLIWNIMWSIG